MKPSDAEVHWEPKTLLDYQFLFGEKLGAAIEAALQGIHDAVGAAGGNDWDKRRTVAHMTGYEDAKFLVKHMYSTMGFPLEESAQWCAEHGYKLDKGGLEHELLCLGMDERSASLNLQRMLDAWEFARKDAIEWMEVELLERMANA